MIKHAGIILLRRGHPAVYVRASPKTAPDAVRDTLRNTARHLALVDARLGSSPARCARCFRIMEHTSAPPSEYHTLYAHKVFS